jgi:hypothetical protein
VKLEAILGTKRRHISKLNLRNLKLKVRWGVEENIWA